METFANMKLLYHPVTELQVGVDVSWHSPLYKTEEEDIDPEALAPYPHIMHESLDFGPYADILTRLHLPAALPLAEYTGRRCPATAGRSFPRFSRSR